MFGAMIRTMWQRGTEAGLHPLATALAEEGFDDAGAERIAERFARHLMVATDHWQEAGFAPIAREYLARLTPDGDISREIGTNGDLRIHVSDKPAETRSLVTALRAPSWLDPKSHVAPLVRCGTRQ